MTQTEHRNSAPNAQQAPQPAESGAPENLNRAGRYDLHIHSAISDGTQSLTELVPLIARAGLAGFALTDHDTTAGWAQAAQLAGEYGLDFLPGAEFSCRYRYTDGEGRARRLFICSLMVLTRWVRSWRAVWRRFAPAVRAVRRLLWAVLPPTTR